MRSPTSLPPDALQALQNGNKIEAIRLVREHSGLGLSEAKYLVDSHSLGGHEPAANEPFPNVSLAPGGQRRSIPFLWVAILLIVAAYVIYRVFVAP